MLSGEILEHLGLYAVRGFLEPALCGRILQEARAATGVAATLWRVGNTLAVDPTFRRTRMVEMPGPTAAAVSDRLEGARLPLQEFFGLRGAVWQPLQFLVYREGDFFRPHADSAPPSETLGDSVRRRVSLVVFLNEPGPAGAPHAYGGGELAFYDLVRKPGWEGVALPVAPAPGLLLAFRSEVTHAVSPVTHGERYTIVTWLAAGSPSP